MANRMAEVRSYRVSSDSMAMLCGGSVHGSAEDVLIEWGDDQPAAKGRALHGIAAGGGTELPEISPYVHRHGVTTHEGEQDVRILAFTMRKFWAEGIVRAWDPESREYVRVRAWDAFPAPLIEVALEQEYVSAEGRGGQGQEQVLEPRMDTNVHECEGRRARAKSEGQGTGTDNGQRTVRYRRTGHLDLLSLLGPDPERPVLARIVDYKTTKHVEASNPRAQRMGYCTLTARRWPSLRHWQYFIPWIREASCYSSPVLSVEDLRAYEERFVEEVVGWNGRWRPGDHCSFCPRLLECPAQSRVMRKGRRDFLDDCEERFELLDDAEVVDGYGVVQQLGRVTKLYRDLAKARCIQSGGILRGSGGKDLKRIERVREDVVPAAAWKALLEAIGPERLGRCVKIIKGEVEAAIKAGAPNRQKTAAWTEFVDHLRGIDALEAVDTSWMGLVSK